MSCSFEPDVLRLDDGELSTERRYLIEVHLAVCPSCARIEETLDLVEQTLRGAPETPLGVIGPALAALAPRKRYVKRVTIAAALLIAASLALLPGRESAPLTPVVELPQADRPHPGHVDQREDLPLPQATTSLRDLIAGADLAIPDEARRVADRVVAAGAPGSAALARMLADPELAPRALTVASFAPRARYVEPAAGLLADPEFGPAAARLLGQIGSPHAVPALEHALDGPHAIEAREALVAIGGESAATVLARRSGDDAAMLDALVRTAPAHAAVLWTEPDAPAFDRVLLQRRDLLLPALRQIAGGRDPRRAAAAALLLGRVGDAKSVALLRRLARDLRTRSAAVEALVAIGTLPALEAAIAVCYRAGSESGLEAHFGGARAAESILLRTLDTGTLETGTLETGTVAQQSAALRLLAHCGGDAALDRIEQTEWRGGLVRDALVAAGMIGTPRAVAVLLRWRNRAALRPALIDALGATGQAAAVPYLRSLEERDATRAAMALGSIAHTDSVRALIELLDYDRGATAAANALAQMPARLVVPVLLESLARRSVARRAHDVLVRMTGMDLGREPETWRRWWNTRS